MSDSDSQTIQDPFKMGVLTALVAVGRILKAHPMLDEEATIEYVESLIKKLPSGDRPLDDQDEHTIALRWLLSGLRPPAPKNTQG